ncbi:hypothetical protein RJ641_003223 [Dillenia turbinata]|uniref:Uncharacterized protein n=1 Tax=Dillenia turbinata TaxID=194707 RepID=A0AAN8VCG7_9MAGN
MDMAASMASFNVFTPKFVNAKVRVTSLVYPNSVFFKSRVSPIPIKFHSLRIYHRTKTTKMYNFPTIASSVDDDGEVDSESINSVSNDSRTCAGCLQHHKLVDNLNLVVENDLREEITKSRLGDGAGTVSSLSGLAGGAGGLGGFGDGAGAWCLLCLCLLLLCFEGVGAGEGTNTGAGAGDIVTGVGAGAGGAIDGDGGGSGVPATGGGVAGGRVGAIGGGKAAGSGGKVGDVTGGGVDVFAGGCVADVGVLEGGNGVGTIVGDAAGACALAIPTKARQAKKHANQSEAILW